MGKSFWKTQGWGHGIAIIYDDNGNGYIDDPGKRCFEAVNVRNVFNSLASIFAVYEITATAVGNELCPHVLLLIFQ